MRRILAIGQVFSQPRHVVPGSALGSNNRVRFLSCAWFDSPSRPTQALQSESVPFTRERS
jgi:hypothetical protein